MKQKNIILIGIGAAIAAAAAIFFLKKNKNQAEKPPKGAPQVKVENPGDQSEFTTAPSDSDLG